MRAAVLLTLLGIFLITPAARAQRDAPRRVVGDELETRFLRQQRIIDDRLNRQRLDDAPFQTLTDFQWGGWLEYYAFNYSDGYQASRTVQRPGLAVWARLRVDDGAHEVFTRMKLRYTHFNAGDEFDLRTDWWGPNFDQLWYQIDVGKAFRLTEPADPIQFRARVGRQSVVFGTGYALDMPMDAVLLDTSIYDLRLQALFAAALEGYPNIDRSLPVRDRNNRCFYGLQLTYEGLQRHVPFAYVLWNDSHQTEHPRDPFQNYDYDSFYVGAGGRGELLQNLNYWAEGVFQTGSSYGNGSFYTRNHVQAFAWDIGLEYLFDLPTRPRIAGEYMFASGDNDRLGSPTNARGGNRVGTPDTSFIGFGLRDTGLVLAPALSNLQIWRVSGSCAPLEHWDLFRDFEVGTNWFLFYKHRPRGAISDPLADQSEGNVGWEMDYFINWRLASDVSWTIRYGMFFPGSAYSDQSQRHFLFTGLTWSF